jgi:6-phosphogluconolactonase (cycloisomerase 2 family)
VLNSSDTACCPRRSWSIETPDPAHFTLSADGKRLYLCNTGTPGGVSAFEVEDRKTGALRLMNYKESKVRGPSYVSVDKSGHYVLDANYGGGFVEVYSLAADGSLDQQTAFVEHQGSSIHPQRQTKPYAHWIRTDPTNKFALVTDLGTDHIVVYHFDDRTENLAQRAGLLQGDRRSARDTWRFTRTANGYMPPWSFPTKCSR